MLDFAEHKNFRVILYGKAFCFLFTFLCYAGLLLSIVTKHRDKSPNYMRPFTPYFRCDCVREACNGITIAALLFLATTKIQRKILS